MRKDIATAFAQLEQRGQTRLKDLPQTMLEQLPEDLFPDENVLAVRLASAGGLHDGSRNVGVLALTDRRLVFWGLQGGGGFWYSALDAVEEGRPRSGSSSLRVSYHGRGYSFLFPRQSNAAGEYVAMISRLLV
ncbi:MAG: hypothetical protein ACRD0K_02770 [Egibacteraceae bacterium]